MSNEIVVQAKALTLAERKKNLEESMLKAELELQGLVASVPNEKIKEMMVVYKSKFATLQNTRKDFTSYVTTVLISPFIEIEKRVDPDIYEGFKGLVKRELDLRVAAASAAEISKATTKEKADYKEHVSNEFSRVHHNIKMRMMDEIVSCIRLGIPPTCDELTQVFIDLVNKPKFYNKMETKYLTPAEKLEVAKTVPQPNYNNLIAEMKLEASVLAAAANKANSFTVGNELDEILDAAIVAADKKLEDDKAENKLIASHEASEVKVSTVKIIKQRKIIFENTKDWAEAIISTFYENDTAWLMLKNKSFDKVTIGQMAEALSKCSDIDVVGVKYEEVTK